MTSPGPGRRAFDRDGLGGRSALFVLAAVAAVAVAFLERDRPDVAWLSVGAALSGLTVVLAIALPWPRLPSWADAAPPLLYFLAAGALRHATGGSESGYSPLFLMPVLWFALFGTRRQVGVAVGALAVAMLVPIILVGEPVYPFEEWRRLVILLIVATALGVIVQRLVQDERAQSVRARQRGRALAEQRDVTAAMIEAASDAVLSLDQRGTIVAANAAAAALFGRTDLLGRNVFETLVPEHESERLRQGLGRLLQAGEPSGRETRFDADLRRADGTLVPVEITMAQTDGPTGRRLHTFVRDATTRRAAEHGAQEHLGDLERLLEVARELGDRAGDSRTAICAAARDLSSADFVLFFVTDPDGKGLIVAGSSGDPNVPTDVILDPHQSIAGQVVATGVPVFSGDLLSDPRVDPLIVQRVRARAAFWQPVTSEDQTVGVLIAYWRSPQEALPERTATLLGLFAAQAAVVLERSDMLARLEVLARTDSLTGAANRRALDDALQIAFADAKRSGRPLSVAMLDLDHFKRYNDRHGHLAGDDLLRRAVGAWRRELRLGDTLARYGGEEFVALLPACDGNAVVAVADRLRAVVPDSETASAGTATWDGDEAVDALFSRMDAALYEAKRAGRDRTVAGVASPGDRRSTGGRKGGVDPVP